MDLSVRRDEPDTFVVVWIHHFKHIILENIQSNEVSNVFFISFKDALTVPDATGRILPNILFRLCLLEKI